MGNTNVTDAFIANAISAAVGIVNSYLSDAYSLPLAKFFQKDIVFSGTGSGSGTMTIIVGGESIAFAITNGMTAAQAADAFREAAIDNTAFVTDSVGNGATVAMFNITGSTPSQLAITSSNPQTVTGITATAGSSAEVAVPLVEAATTGIASAQLLINEYGAEAQDSNKDGYKLMAFWTGLLESIRDKKTKVMDFAGNELPVNSNKLPRFFPTASSENDPVNPTKSSFTKNQKF